MEEDESGAEVAPVGMTDWVALAHLPWQRFFKCGLWKPASATAMGILGFPQPLGGSDTQ